MVRKRAQAEKALSPPRETSKADTDSRNNSASPEEIPRKRQKQEPESTDQNGGQVKSPTYGIATTDETENSTNTSPDLLHDEYDQLPDPLTLQKELSDEGKAFWETATKDYHHFSNWTTLLQYITETEDNLEASQAVYRCFLRYFPYCYGYWKKFADIEKRNGNLDAARKIFEDGLKAFPISVDLWVHYINFLMQQNKGKPEKQQEIRETFKRAVNSAGMEFKSSKLWNAFIEWENSQSNLKNITEIYDQLICTPTQQYIKNWQKFKVHLETYRPGEILPAKEYGKLMKEMDAFPPGMVIEDDKSGDEEGEVTLGEDEGLLKESYTEVRNRVLKDRESVFRQTAQEIVKRWRFEESIKRPYFHIKPLEKSQIKNWKDYLDYELKQGNHKRIVFLFERCIVVCALYDFFWEKYLDYIETKDPSQARTVFLRACNIHLDKKYKLHLRWAIFEERQRNMKLSAAILSRIDSNFPGMILITQHRIGLARRMRDFDELVSIYEKVIESSERIEDKIFYSIKFSHSLVKFCNKKDQAREVLWSALELGKKHKRLYLTLLDLETHYGSIEIEFVKKLFDAIQKDLTLEREFRLSCAQKKVEFYEEFADSIDDIVEAQNAYAAEQKKVEARQKEDQEERNTYSRSANQGEQEQISVHENTHYAQQHQQQQAWFPPNNAGGHAANFDWQQQYAAYSQYNNRQ